MCQEFNTPNFRINVFVYHPVSGNLVSSYHIDQSVGMNQGSFNRVTKACTDLIESAQSTDGLRYVAYYPIWESWRQGGNRVFESTLQA